MKRIESRWPWVSKGLVGCLRLPYLRQLRPQLFVLPNDGFPVLHGTSAFTSCLPHLLA